MESTQQTQTEAPETKETSVVGKSGLSGATIAIIVMVLLGAGLGGYAYMTSKDNGTSPLSLSSLFGKDRASEGPVARVNGEEISRASFDEAVANMRANLEAQGADLTNAELSAQIETQVLTSLIDSELLRQTALKNGFTATTEEIKGEYDALATQLGGLETLTSQMASVGLTDAELRADIEKQLTIRKYLTATIDTGALAVTEEEIATFYEGIELPEGGLPPLDEVRTQIEAQLKLEKEQKAITDLVSTLKSAATIETLI